MIFTRPRRGQKRVAAPNREGNYFRAADAQLPRDLREKPVVTHHQAQLAEARVEYRVLNSRRDSALDFRARQSCFPVLAEHPAVRTGQDGHVVNQVLVALDESHDEIHVVQPRERAEIVRGRSRDRLRCFGV